MWWRDRFRINGVQLPHSPLTAAAVAIVIHRVQAMSEVRVTKQARGSWVS